MADSFLMRRLAEVYAGTPIAFEALRAVTLAQWLLESGRGTSRLANGHYNFAGLKWRSEMKPPVHPIDYAAHDGTGRYCAFATLSDFVIGYWAFLARPPYAGWQRYGSDPQAFMRFVGPIYTPAPGYADRVLALAGEAARMLADAPAARSVARRGTPDLGTLVLDPGHGGSRNAPGSSANNAISARGVAEKALTLDFCLMLRDLLLAQAEAAGEGLRVVLTRNGDVNLAGSVRAAVAAATKARAFVCWHFNGSGDPGVRGPETFYRAAANGNLNLAADMRFAGAVHRGLTEGLRAIDPATPDRGVKPDDRSGPGALGVLNDRLLCNDRRAEPCVATYVEAEFITHPDVDRLLVSGSDAIANRERVLASVARAIRDQLRSG